MKKILLPLVGLILLNSCGIPASERLMLATRGGVPALANDYQSLAMGDFAVPLTINQFDQRLNADEDFILYIGQAEDKCYGCKLAGPALREYIAKSHSLIYYLDVSDWQVATDFQTTYAERYAFEGTPTMLFINDGEFAYDQKGADRISSSLKVQNLIAGYTTPVPITYLFDSSEISARITAGAAMMVIDYQFEPANALYQSLKPLISTEDNFLLLDWQFLTIDEQTSLTEQYQISLTAGASIVRSQLTLNFTEENNAAFTALFDD